MLKTCNTHVVSFTSGEAWILLPIVTNETDFFGDFQRLKAIVENYRKMAKSASFQLPPGFESFPHSLIIWIDESTFFIAYYCALPSPLEYKCLKDRLWFVQWCSSRNWNNARLLKSKYLLNECTWNVQYHLLYFYLYSLVLKYLGMEVDSK